MRLRAEHRPGPYGGYYLIFDDGSTPAKYVPKSPLGKVQKYHNVSYNRDFWHLEAEDYDIDQHGFETLKGAVELLLTRLKMDRLT